MAIIAAAASLFASTTAIALAEGHDPDADTDETRELSGTQRRKAPLLADYMTDDDTEVPDDAVKSRLTESVVELNGLWGRNFAWNREEAQPIVNASSFSGLGSVTLNQWLKASRASLGASVDAWCRFVGEDLPDPR